MDALQHAKALAADGRFASALQTLRNGPIRSPDKTRADVMRAEMLQQVGQSSESLGIVTAILKSRSLTPHDESLCHLVVDGLATGDGRLDVAREHLQKDATIALGASEYAR